MQYLKEEVKARIRAAALAEFEAHGFDGAKMRRIAKGAGVAIGNIYTYFKSKDEIFGEIVSSCHGRIVKLGEEMVGLADYGRGDVKLIARDITEGIMNIHTAQGRELLVIVDKSAGSQHENFPEVLCQMVYEHIKRALEFDLRAEDELLIRTFSKGFVNGLFTLLREVKDRGALQPLINRLLVLYFDDLHSRLSRE